MANLNLSLKGKKQENVTRSDTSIQEAFNENNARKFSSFSEKIKGTAVYGKIHSKLDEIAAIEDHVKKKNEMETLIVGLFDESDADKEDIRRIVDKDGKEYVEITFGGEKIAVELSGQMVKEFVDFFIERMQADVNELCKSKDAEASSHEDVELTYQVTVAAIEEKKAEEGKQGAGEAGDKKKSGKKKGTRDFKKRGPLAFIGQIGSKISNRVTDKFNGWWDAKPEEKGAYVEKAVNEATTGLKSTVTGLAGTMASLKQTRKELSTMKLPFSLSGSKGGKGFLADAEKKGSEINTPKPGGDDVA